MKKCFSKKFLNCIFLGIFVIVWLFMSFWSLLYASGDDFDYRREPELNINWGNDVVTLESRDQTFIYTIIQLIPEWAENIVFENVLEDELEVVSVDVDIDNITPLIEWQKVMVMIEDPIELYNEEVRINIQSKIRENISDDVLFEKYGDTIVINTATVTIDNDVMDTNMVIVSFPKQEIYEPEIGSILVDKIWMDEDGSELVWPQGVSVEVIAEYGSKGIQTAILTAESPSVRFSSEEEEGGNRYVQEEGVEWYNVIIEQTEEGFKIINQKEPEPEVPETPEEPEPEVPETPEEPEPAVPTPPRIKSSSWGGSVHPKPITPESTQDPEPEHGSPEEERDMHQWAYDNWLTIYKPWEDAKFDHPLTRQQMAKISSIFWAKFLNQKADDSEWKIMECSQYKDLSKLKWEMRWYVIQSCLLWNMWYHYDNVNYIPRFMPYKGVSVAEASVILSRMAWWDKYIKTPKQWYQWHMQAVYDHGLIDDISDPKKEITRWEAFLMMYRLDKLMKKSS